MNDPNPLKRSHNEAIDEQNDTSQSLFLEEETDRVPAYDAKKEGLPDCKLYTPEYGVIEDGKFKFSRLIDTPFQETTFHSGPTDGLQEDHKRRLKDHSADKIKVGVVGDMSSGIFHCFVRHTRVANSFQAKAP